MIKKKIIKKNNNKIKNKKKYNNLKRKNMYPNNKLLLKRKLKNQCKNSIRINKTLQFKIYFLFNQFILQSLLMINSTQN